MQSIESQTYLCNFFFKCMLFVFLKKIKGKLYCFIFTAPSLYWKKKKKRIVANKGLDLFGKSSRNDGKNNRVIPTLMLEWFVYEKEWLIIAIDFQII